MFHMWMPFGKFDATMRLFQRKRSKNAQKYIKFVKAAYRRPFVTSHERGHQEESYVIWPIWSFGHRDDLSWHRHQTIKKNICFNHWYKFVTGKQAHHVTEAEALLLLCSTPFRAARFIRLRSLSFFFSFSLQHALIILICLLPSVPCSISA